MSKHSNIKPVEPEKPAQTVIEEEPPKVIREPVKPSALTRPSFNSELITLKPEIAPALKQAIDNLVITKCDKKETSNNKLYDHLFIIN